MPLFFTMKPLLKSVLLIIAFGCITTKFADAQLKTKLTLGGSYYSGNVDKSDIISTGNTAWNDSLYEFSAFYKIAYGTTNGEEINREFSGGVKFDNKPQSTFSPFLMLKAYNNTYKGYDLRLSVLAGVKYAFYRGANGSYSISGAFIYDRESYTPNTETGIKNPDMNLLRLSIRPKFSQKIGKFMTLEHTTFFMYKVYSSPEEVVPVPKPENYNNDWMIESSTTLSNKLSKKMSLQLSYDINYTGKPPSSNIKNTDKVFVVSLVLDI